MYFFQTIGLLIVDLDSSSQSWRFFCSKKIAIFSAFIMNLFYFTWSVTGLIDSYLKTTLDLRFSLFDLLFSIVIDAFSAFVAQFLRVMYMLRREGAAEISNKIIH